ncbi:MAG: AsmA-like C-terminal region-containing protein, partial [Pseudomonadota bacterium]|nr:AsmA-like C-terminal region-containing protein [Pseudomonadota bacterium]
VQALTVGSRNGEADPIAHPPRLARLQAGGNPQTDSFVAVNPLGGLLLAGLGVVAAFPFDLARGAIADRLGAALGAHVAIGSIERQEFLSFSPTLNFRDVTVRQPAWAGRGNMLDAQKIEARISILPLLVGRSPDIDRLVAHALSVNLVRDASGRANWGRRQSKEASGRDSGTALRKLIIHDARVTLRDEKRHLKLDGRLASDAKGLRVDARGQFHDAPATLALRGDPIASLETDARYPLHLDLKSPLLHLRASGHTQGALNLRAMTLDIRATSPNLAYLDDIIEAGLFGSRPINLKARVRHAQSSWFIDHMTGSIGRSRLDANAQIHKRNGRTKIEAVTHFSTFDFDDLSDAEGKAEARAREARIGPRVLPGTRINLAKIGPTDGTIEFRADRLLMSGSAFRSLSGRIRLEGKHLTVREIVAGMKSGRLTGEMDVDQRGGVAHPRLTLNLSVEGARLETVMGSPDATGPLRSHIRLAGTGDTIRDALAHADGRAGLIVQDGSVKKTVAAVLGQDLGKTLGSLLKDKKDMVPLRCLAIGFEAHDGMLTPRTFLADTQISIGEGKGRISLASETIALSIRGRTREPSGLRLKDPIVVSGTLSAPALGAAGKPPGSKVNAGSVLS